MRKSDHAHHNEQIRSMTKSPVSILASFFYIGYLPVSGTFASLAAIPLFLLLHLLGSYPVAESFFYLLITCLLAGVGIWCCNEGERIFMEHDSHKIVFDEVVGYLFTMLWLPVTFWTVAGGFALFRFFDIVKPFPIGASQKLPGGLGVMADDILAGFAAMGVMQILLLVF